MTQTLLNRLSCYISGHDYTIRQAAGRMLLVCTACGHRSDGVPLIGRHDANHARPSTPSVRPSAPAQRRSS